jgi:hypothetical protein
MENPTPPTHILLVDDEPEAVDLALALRLMTSQQEQNWVQQAAQPAPGMNEASPDY